MGLPLSPLAQTPQEQRDQAGLGRGQASGRGGRAPCLGSAQLRAGVSAFSRLRTQKGWLLLDEASSGGCSDAVDGRRHLGPLFP